MHYTNDNIKGETYHQLIKIKPCLILKGKLWGVHIEYSQWVSDLS